MAIFSQVPINQVSLSGMYTSLSLGSDPGLNGSGIVNFIQFIADGSEYTLSSLNVPTSGGGGGATFPTIGQLYPYF